MRWAMFSHIISCMAFIIFPQFLLPLISSTSHTA
jgi:hypothetical protein